MADEQTTPKRRWRPQFSLLALLLGVIFFGACGGLWWRWEPWAVRFVLTEHDDAVLQVAFSNDGERVITATKSGAMHVWDTKNGQQVLSLDGHSGHIRSICFSSDGRRVVTASGDGTARVWELRSGRACLVLRANMHVVYHARFMENRQHIVTVSQDGSGTSYSYPYAPAPLGSDALGSGVVFSDHSVRIWQAQSGKEVFLKDGKYVTLSSPWLAEMEQLRPVLRGLAGPLSSAVLSPDGQTVATVIEGGAVLVWDAMTGREKARLADNRPGLQSVAFSRSGDRLYIGSDNGSVRVWDTATGDWIAEFERSFRSVDCLCISSNGRSFISRILDHTVRIRDCETGRELAWLCGHTDLVAAADFSADGDQIATGSLDGTARLWFPRRPEYWWGIAWLPEFWIALVSGVGLVAMAVRRVRSRRSS